MQFRDTTERFGSVTKTLHWIIAILFVTQFYLIYWKESMLPVKSPLANFYINGLHKPLGIVILCLAIFTILWRFHSPRPLFPNTMQSWEVISARLVHFILYLILLIMPISGFMMSSAAGYPPNFFGLFQFPLWIEVNKEMSKFFFDIHQMTSFVAIALVTLHILAALKHHFIQKDNILKRMLP